jgi:hypothetical protein
MLTQPIGHLLLLDEDNLMSCENQGTAKVGTDGACAKYKEFQRIGKFGAGKGGLQSYLCVSWELKTGTPGRQMKQTAGRPGFG